MDRSPPSPYDRGGYDQAFAEVPVLADSISWRPNAYGPGSAPEFIDSYKEYLERLGFFPQNISGQAGNVIEGAEPVTLLSDYTPHHGAPALDLRVFLPARALAERLLEAFRVSIQTFKPVFYWPTLERKLERAWSAPMWETDGQVVGEVFCIVMIVMAVGAQLVNVDEMYPPGDSHMNISQER